MLERGLSDTKIINILDKNFKIKIINMLMELEKIIQDVRKEFRKETGTLKNRVFEMKHTIGGLKSR